jgi:hypothetical protein
MAEYPVSFDIRQPEKFDRTHIVIRILILVILGAIGVGGWVLYLAVPVLAAILISQKGGAAYLAESESTMTRWLRYLVGFLAYLMLLTDRLPNEEARDGFVFEVKPGGSPTAGNALMRILLAIPSALVLWLLSIIGLVLAVIAAVMVLVQESYAAGIYEYLRGLMRWEARLLAYLASLVEEYPPFALDTGVGGAGAVPASP